jgi:hypothetical protein
VVLFIKMNTFFQNIKNFLPSKKIFVFLIIPLLLIIIIFSVILFKNKNQKNIKISNFELDLENLEQVKYKNINEDFQQITKTIAKKDTDKDGLKDWEENLWNTNINSADTDNDGKTDLEEIKNNTDPLVSGPNDQIKKQEIKNQVLEKQQEQLEELTATDQLAREFFATYIQLKQMNALDTELEEKMIDSMLEKTIINEDFKQKNIYTKNDIKIITDDFENIKKYRDGFKKIFFNNPKQEYELFIVKNAVDNNKPEELKKLDLSLELIQKILIEYLNLEVPQEISDKHLQMINLLNNLHGNIKIMRNVFTDAMGAMINANLFFENETELLSISTDIGLYFKNYNLEL